MTTLNTKDVSQQKLQNLNLKMQSLIANQGTGRSNLNTHYDLVTELKKKDPVIRSMPPDKQEANYISYMIVSNSYALV